MAQGVVRCHKQCATVICLQMNRFILLRDGLVGPILDLCLCPHSIQRLNNTFKAQLLNTLRFLSFLSFLSFFFLTFGESSSDCTPEPSLSRSAAVKKGVLVLRSFSSDTGFGLGFGGAAAGVGCNGKLCCGVAGLCFL